jgi:Ion channel
LIGVGIAIASSVILEPVASLPPMTDSTATPSGAPQQAQPQPWMIARGLLRALATTVALVALYYLLPLDHSTRWLAITILVIGLVALIGLIAFQVRTIIVSPFPGLRAVEALATSIPLFLLLFASTYVVMGAIAANSFNQPMTRTDALYFTVTVFATVGFGDITAKTETARLLVTGQMIVDLIILGIGARVILGAVQRGRQRQPHDTRTTHPDQ